MASSRISTVLLSSADQVPSIPSAAPGATRASPAESAKLVSRRSCPMVMVRVAASSLWRESHSGRPRGFVRSSPRVPPGTGLTLPIVTSVPLWSSFPYRRSSPHATSIPARTPNPKPGKTTRSLRRPEAQPGQAVHVRSALRFSPNDPNPDPVLPPPSVPIQRAIRATTAPTSLTRSPGASPISRPRRPPLT